MALILELLIKSLPYVALFGIWSELERIRKALSKSKNEDKEQK